MNSLEFLKVPSILLVRWQMMTLVAVNWSERNGFCTATTKHRHTSLCECWALFRHYLTLFSFRKLQTDFWYQLKDLCSLEAPDDLRKPQILWWKSIRKKCFHYSSLFCDTTTLARLMKLIFAFDQERRFPAMSWMVQKIKQKQCVKM